MITEDACFMQLQLPGNGMSNFATVHAKTFQNWLAL